MPMRTAYLFNRSVTSNPALGNATYNTAVSATLSEEQVYHPGLYETYPALAKVSRGAAGVTVKIKFQGTNDFSDLTLIGVGDAQISIFALSAGRSIQFAQSTTPGTLTSHTTDTSTLLTTVTLACDTNGKPADTGTTVSNYLASNLNTLFTAAVVGAGTGIFGATYRALPIPLAPVWTDILSTRQDNGTANSEHTLDAGVGNANVPFGFQVHAAGWRSIRCVGTGTAAPATGDALAVTMSLPG